jgi:predicted phosphodiesterase
MKTIIHCADLHLASEEQDYAFKVLDELFLQAKKRDVDLILFAGDLFNSFKDAETLRLIFREKLAGFKKALPQCRILFLPGNHEYLRKGQATLTNLDLGPLTVLEENPFQFMAGEDLEILAIPHQLTYKNYIEWAVPPKKAPFRLALAHGSVSGMAFLGLEHMYNAGITEEEGGSVIDPDLFTRFQIDYAALGHIHAPRQQKLGSTLLYYPGSARVWRKGELGPRFFNCLQIDKQITVTPVTLQTAGQYRYYDWPLSLTGELPDMRNEAVCWKKEDWLDIRLTGIVEDEKKVAELAHKLEEQFGRTVRRLDIARDEIMVLEGISSQPIVQKFLELWQKRLPAPADTQQQKVWLKAREVALHKIREYLKARS